MEHNHVKGQATMEFLLTLVIGLLYIVTVVQPNSELATRSMEDTANMAKLRISSDKIIQSIQYASVSGEGTREVLQAVIPKDSNITCGTFTPPFTQGTTGNSMRFIYRLKSTDTTAACEKDFDPIDAPQLCTKVLQAGTTFACQLNSNPSSAIVNPGIYSVTVTKISGNPAVNVNFELIQ